MKIDLEEARNFFNEWLPKAEAEEYEIKQLGIALCDELQTLRELVGIYRKHIYWAEKISDDLWKFLKGAGMPLPIIMLRAKELRTEIAELEKGLSEKEEEK